MVTKINFLEINRAGIINKHFENCTTWNIKRENVSFDGANGNGPASLARMVCSQLERIGREYMVQATRRSEVSARTGGGARAAIALTHAI